MILLAAACHSPGSSTDSVSPTDSVINAAGADVDPVYRAGAKLVAASDCFTCHKVDEKMIGPSFSQIAAKYHFNEGNVDNLAGKIISGGKGLWGDVPMTAHPGLAANDAAEMVRYILSLRKTSP